jgi:hypothetical protein
MATAVNDRSAEATALAEDHPMLEALMKGTRAMRGAAEQMLPKWPNEEPTSYAARKSTATLFPAYRRTVSVMSGKPFSKEAVLSDDTPEQIKLWAEDIDREGVSLHVFAQEMFGEGFYGLAGILVEAPKPPEPTGAVVTVADEKAAGIRPYFVRVMHGQILGWRVSTINGARILTQLRLSECAKVEDGEFGEKTVDRVRVLEPGSWRLFEESETAGADGKKQWTEIDKGSTGLAYIPFVPIYGHRKGFMCGSAPLLDLAYLNVKHWQSQSDQDTILHVARVPILAMTCGDDAPALTVGASSAVKLPIGGTLEFVEHTGQAIKAGADSLSDLEQQMIQAGAELLVKKPGDRSATEAAGDLEANKCDLQRMVEGFEAALDAALQMLAEYAKLGTGGKITLFKDFGAANLTDASAQLIATLEGQGIITKETAIKELQRRGALSPDLDPDEEVQAVADQAPDLTLIDPLTGKPPVPPEGQQAA